MFEQQIPAGSTIAVLVSGGVDSAVALHILKEHGYDVTAFYLKVWMEGDTFVDDCPWREDVDYVQKVADHLHVAFEIVPMQREYWDRVVEYTLKEVERGLTPNPDMMCNKLIKFGAFHQKYGKNFSYIASGHYAKTVWDEQGTVHLLTSMDSKKDQTYFLSQMSRKQLGRSVFPLGDLTKPQVRGIAATLNLANSQRPDSQGICFLGKINYREFISRHVGRKTGKIVERSTGRVLGDHEGFWFYTIGQRFGLRLSGGPWFVVDKDGANNIIYVAHGRDPEQVYTNRIQVQAFNWINPPHGFLLHQGEVIKPESEKETEHELPLAGKIRHAPDFFQSRVTISPGGRLTIYPESKIAGVAKGQFAVLYQGKECLGGGVIC